LSLTIAAARNGAADAELRELEGRQVGWFRLAGGSHRGAIGPVEADVVERLVRLAVDVGAPIVGELATSGADIAAGVASLHGWGRIARALVDASGVVPILLTVSGPCVSGPALLLGLADHVVMTVDAFAYVSGPEAVAQITGGVVDHATLGGPTRHDRSTGVASIVAADEEDARHAIFDLLSFLPDTWLDEAPYLPTTDRVDRTCAAAVEAVPESATASYDVRVVIRDVVDAGTFLEVRSGWASSMVTGYARIEGRVVGVVANQPAHLAGTVDIDAARKAGRFVQSCDAFGLPLVTFVDTPGFLPGKELEWRGMIRHGATLVHAYAEATVPRVAVVLRKAYGGAYIVMDSRGLGNDACFAWPSAEIAVMGASGAVQILHRDVAPDDRAELEAAYAAQHCTPTVAADRGYVDAVIDPLDTRRVLAGALRSLRRKRATHAAHKKHSNTPF
jgi:acetyl-CoA carboxylase carboxyltransferase component